MVIYMITVYKAAVTPGNWHTRTRTWGYYANFDTAERAVLENWTDMFECNYYDRAVIESVEEGICTLAKDMCWYTATYEDEVLRVDVTAKPEWAYGICNMWGG